MALIKSTLDEILFKPTEIDLIAEFVTSYIKVSLSQTPKTTNFMLKLELHTLTHKERTILTKKWAHHNN